MQNIKKERSKLFVLIDCCGGNAPIMDKILVLDNVKEVKETVGPYSMMVTLESESNEELKETLQKIRMLKTIRGTLTLRASNDLEVLG